MHKAARARQEQHALFDRWQKKLSELQEQQQAALAAEHAHWQGFVDELKSQIEELKAQGEKAEKNIIHCCGWHREHPGFWSSGHQRGAPSVANVDRQRWP